MINVTISKANRKYLILLIFLLISILLLFSRANRSPRTNLIKKFSIWIISPIQKLSVEAEKGINKIHNNIIEFGTLKEQNLNLKKQLDFYRQREGTYRETIIENKRLREILNFKSHKDFDYISSEVIGKNPTNWYKTITINAGYKDGLKENMTVLTPHGLVGKVTEVIEYRSKVQLILDLNSAVGVMIERTRTIGILRGLSQKTCQMDYVSRTFELEIGDMVITSGLGGIFPKGLPVGRVSKIEKKNYGIFQYVEVTPDVNFYNLEEVIILKTPFFAEIVEEEESEE